MIFSLGNHPSPPSVLWVNLILRHVPGWTCDPGLPWVPLPSGLSNRSRRDHEPSLDKWEAASGLVLKISTRRCSFSSGVKDWSLQPSCYYLGRGGRTEANIEQRDGERQISEDIEWLDPAVPKPWTFIFWVDKISFGLSHFELLFFLLLLKSPGKHSQGEF